MSGRIPLMLPDGLNVGTRFACCTPGVLDACLRGVAGGANLDDLIPGFTATEVALVAKNSVEVEDMGASLAGMSTVLEAIAARHLHDHW